MKTKNIYTARINKDDELADRFCSKVTGQIDVWGLESKGVTWSIYLSIPDFSSTDVIVFDVLFDEDFRKDNDVKIGDRFQVTFPFPKHWRDRPYEIEITDIKQGEPINYLENKRPVKKSSYSVTTFLEYYLYHYLGTDECHDVDGWFDTEKLIADIKNYGFYFDMPTLELIFENEDGRYYFNSDKSKFRIAPEHPAPRNVEELLKTAGEIKIKRHVFAENKLPFIKDKKRAIKADCSNGDSYRFTFETNKVFRIDEKRFLMLIEFHGEPMLAVSPYMLKDGKDRYRMIIPKLPQVINYLVPADVELTDYEGRVYKVTIVDAE